MRLNPDVLPLSLHFRIMQQHYTADHAADVPAIRAAANRPEETRTLTLQFWRLSFYRLNYRPKNTM